MEIAITPRSLRGTIKIIASKSRAHRLLICAALSKNPSRLVIGESSQDIDATVRCLNALGADIQKTDEGFSVLPITKVPCDAVLDCGESGSTLRFLLPVIGALGCRAKLKLSGRLPSRPLSPLWEELEKGGMTLAWADETTLSCGGKLKSGAYTLPGNISSQYISGMLFALPLLSGDSTLYLTEELESAQYIAMTEDAIRTFGISFTFQNSTYKIPGLQRPSLSENAPLEVEGDWSNAAFWLVAGSMGEGITCEGLNPLSLQGDKEIVHLLRTFGAKVEESETAVSVSKNKMGGIEIDASQIPDLVPILAVAACAAEGKTRIYGAKRLKIKESDRLQTVFEMLSALGANITKHEDGLTIIGGTPLSGGTVDSAGDHRIAMSAAVASTLCTSSVFVKGAEAVNKSYPKFWEHFSALGGAIERREAK